MSHFRSKNSRESVAMAPKGHNLATGLLLCFLVASLVSAGSASTLNYASAVKAGTTPRPQQGGNTGANPAQPAQPIEPQVTSSNSAQNHATPGRAGGYCQINIKKSEELPKIQPLILHPNKLEFMHPQSSQAVRIDSSHAIRLVCPGEANVFSLSKGTTRTLQSVTPTCVRRNAFNARDIQQNDLTIRDLGCDNEFSATALPTNETCLGKKFSRVRIGYELNPILKNEFVPTLDLCFDPAHYDAVFSTVKLTPSIHHRQWDVKRPDEFAAGSFYGSIGILQLYTRYKQRETFTTILGSRQMAEKYIPRDPADTKYYLARGHLAPMADFVYGAEQRSTFFYMNVAPQWQIFNQGNWEELEISVRNFVAQRTSGLTVYTGTWGTSMLEDKNGKLQPMYLYVDAKNNKRGVKVPAYFWKVLYDPVTQEGAAFVGINNPFLKNVNNQVFCAADVCANFKWLQWHGHNITMGYSFCCSVEEFRKTVTSLPDFPVKSLFTPESKHCKTYDGCDRPLRNRPHAHGG